MRRIFERLLSIPNLQILAKNHTDRLGVFSFFIDDIHYNLIVQILNDRFGIQTRGGCSCAGTYGHFLLHVDQTTSKALEQKILGGCLKERPGWVRMSIHPTMTNAEIEYICDAIEAVANHIQEWSKEYEYYPGRNEYEHKINPGTEKKITEDWFEL